MSTDERTLSDADIEALAEEIKDDEEILDQLADDNDLADAVREQREEKQNNLGVSRRGLMQTLGAGGLGALLTQSASAADTSSGGVGAPGYSQDIYLDEILDPQGDPVGDLDDSGHFQWSRGHSMPALNTGSAVIGGRDFESGDLTLNPSATTSAVQDALDSIPFNVRGDVTVNIPDGDYGELVVPEFVFKRADANGPHAPVNIQGNDTTPSNVTVDGMYVAGAYGEGSLAISGIEFGGLTSTGDDNASLVVTGAAKVGLQTLNFTDATGAQAAIELRGGGLFADVDGPIDISTGNFNFVINAKAGAHVRYNGNNAGSNAGVPNNAVIAGSNGTGWVATATVGDHGDVPAVLNRDAGTGLVYGEGGSGRWDTGFVQGGMNVALTENNVGNVSVQTGDGQTVSGDTFQTMFNLTNPGYVIGGVIFGDFPDDLRITWGTGTTDTISDLGKTGNDGGGDRIGLVPVPAMADVGTLEFKNESASSSDFGWSILTWEP